MTDYTPPKLFTKQQLGDTAKQAARAQVWSDTFSSNIGRYMARGPSTATVDYATAVNNCGLVADLAVQEFDKRCE